MKLPNLNLLLLTVIGFVVYSVYLDAKAAAASASEGMGPVTDAWRALAAEAPSTLNDRADTIRASAAGVLGGITGSLGR